jgi:Glycosyltransferase like family
MKIFLTSLNFLNLSKLKFDNMISIVCVYNNEDILNRYLIKSIKSQTINYELILLDNTKKQFKSAASALNYGGRKAKGEHIMFVHQDVDLRNNQFLQDAMNYLDSLSNIGIAGVAGKNNYKIITNIKYNCPPQNVGKFQINEPKIVQTLDECLIIIPKSVFKVLEFDEFTCNDWHLYSVDYCLSLASIALYCYVLPLKIYHRSNGIPLNQGYYDTLEKLFQKHCKRFNWINTTMGNWTCKIPVKIQKIKMIRFFLKIFEIFNFRS